ncbi:MAG: polysaccharide biosynthesis C-terminal domain-containing protein [Thermonemataceae bacterium]|nr:polysaccharide biosynthesis C-terminal domain-containing protein [Thermonemataceae bacterium]
MGIIIRQSLKASFVSYIGVFLGLINNVFVSTKFLSPEQIGLLRVLLENSLTFATFAHLGTPFILDKFFLHFRDEKEKNQGFLGFLLVIAFSGILIFSVLYILAREKIANYFVEKSPEILDYHFLSIPLTALWVFLVVLEAYSRNNARIAIPTFIRDTLIKLLNIFLVLVYALGWINFDWVVYGLVCIYIFALGLLLWYIKTLGKLFLQINWQIFKSNLFRVMLVYGLVIVLGGLGENIFNFVDRTMLAAKEGLKETGIFTLAGFIVATIIIPKKTLSQIAIPFLIQALAENQQKKLDEIYKKVALHQFLGGLWVFLGIWICIDELFLIIPKGQIYAEGKWVVFYLGVASLFNLASGLKGEVILYSKSYYFAAVFVFLFSLLNIALNNWFIDTYQINGAAYATAIATILYAFSQAIFVYYKYKVFPYQWKQFFVLIWAAVLYLLIANIFPRPANMGQALIFVVIKSSFITILYFSFLLYFRISDDLSNIFDNLLRKYFYKK